MKFIVKLFPEITIKSKSVRKRFIKLLEGNLRNVLKRVEPECKVMRGWDKIEVLAPELEGDRLQQVIQVLTSTPGIVQVQQVKVVEFETLDDIYQHTRPVVEQQICGKTFCVRVKRSGKHEFTSTDIERYVGGGLNQHCQSAGVKLSKPDVTVKLEVSDNQVYIVEQQHKGLGGFPIATQEDVLSLISGGFDSAISSYQFIKRGSRVHYCFFNLGGAAHEAGVKQVAYHIWNRFGASHRVRFIAIPFEPVVAEILEKVDNGQMGVVLKRTMMRAAAMVAERFGIQALVTGEALGQVSSQTLTNLSVIDSVTQKLILRPLVTMDKQDIIDLARQIGTYDLSASMPEYCGVISQRPTVKAIPEKIEAEEALMDMSLLEKVVSEATYTDIRDLAEQEQSEAEQLEMVDTIAAGEVVLDIRAPEEEEANPLELDGVDVVTLPFYKLASQFSTLDQSKTYLLYCDRGVMSRLQGIYLLEAGHSNIKVLRKSQ